MAYYGILWPSRSVCVCACSVTFGFWNAMGHELLKLEAKTLSGSTVELFEIRHGMRKQERIPVLESTAWKAAHGSGMWDYGLANKEVLQHLPKQRILMLAAGMLSVVFLPEFLTFVSCVVVSDVSQEHFTVCVCLCSSCPSALGESKCSS